MFVCNKCTKGATHFYRIGSVTQPLCEDHLREEVFNILNNNLDTNELQNLVLSSCGIKVGIEEAF